MTDAPQWAREAFAAACAAIDVPSEAGTFLRVGTFATWLLPDHELVARVAAPADQPLVAREYAVAAALEEAEIPVALPARPAFDHATGTVGWWRLGTPTEAGWAALGRVTRQLHDRSSTWLGFGGRCPYRCDLAEQADARLTRAYDVLPDQRAELDAARAHLHDAAAAMAVHAKYNPVIAHGDLSPHNLLEDGRLIDLETAGVGEAAIDLARVVSAVERYGAPLAALEQFALGYGCSLSEFASPRVQGWLKIRDLWATGWAAAYADRDPEIEAEARRRLATLRDPSVTWALI